jgi:hypothetical protein
MYLTELAKAFDCVNRDILLLKLKHYGIQGVNADWFSSYLSNRKQRVELKTNSAQSYHSSWENVKRGVKHGHIMVIYSLFSDQKNVLPICE